MPKQLQSNINYEEVCEELGITMEDLLSLVQGDTQRILEKRVKFVEVIDQFLINLKAQVKINKRSEETFKTYKNFLFRLKEYIDEFYPGLVVEEFNEKLLDEFFLTCKPRGHKNKDITENKESNQKLSNYTVNKYTAIIRKVYKYAYTVDTVNKDLTHRFETVRTKLLPRYFIDEQVNTILLKSIKRTYGYRWRAMVAFMLGTGCRINEVTNLKVRDFDIENNLIYVNGKGNKDRFVPIYPQVKRIVLMYLETSELTKWSRYNEGFLFSRDEGNERKSKISNRSLQYQVKNILKDSNLDKKWFSPHSFRHTFAVNCLKAGMKIEYLSQVLGHTNPVTTTTYVQLLPSDLRDEVMTKYPFPIEALLKEII